MSYNDDNDELDSKLRDDARWEPNLDAIIEREKREEAKQRGLDAIEAAGALDDDLADEEDEQEVEDDHSKMPEFMDRVNLCKQVEILAASAIAKATGEPQC